MIYGLCGHLVMKWLALPLDQIIGLEATTMAAEIDMSTKLKLIGVEVRQFWEFPFMPPEKKGHSIILKN